jgi:dTDP-4-amino-4,6-dideoxygalactose transaminase
MKVPLVDLKRNIESIENDLTSAIERCLENTGFILGDEVKLFEEEFARYCEAEYCIGVNSGTDALHLALRAVGAGEGDAVITVPFTFVATAEAIWMTGALPLFVDIDEDTYTLSTGELRRFLNERVKDGIDRVTGKRVKGIIPVHLYGHPCNMEEIMDLAKKYNLFVIEDCAQAHGARVLFHGKFRRVGSLGNAGCFSFFPAKNLGAFGDGGAVITSDRNLSEKVFMLRNHGRIEKYDHLIKGFNSRLDTIQAAILRAKLKHLDKWNERRREIAKRYIKNLRGVKGIEIKKPKEWAEPVYHLFVIETEKRSELQKELSKNGIATGIHYPIPLHLLKSFEDLGYRKGDFPVSEKCAERVLSLPMFPELKDEEVDRICEIIAEFLS